MENQNRQMDYWEEKEFELAKEVLIKAIGFNDRAATFDPVGYALIEARRLINGFKHDHGIV